MMSEHPEKDKMKIQLNADWKLNDLVTASGILLAQVRFDNDVANIVVEAGQPTLRGSLPSRWIYRIGLNEQWRILQGKNQSETAARTHVELLLERSA